MNTVEIPDVLDEPICIQSVSHDAVTAAFDAVIAISVYEDGDHNTWCGNREQLKRLIKSLQEFESALPPIDDASNLPPMSNRVEGGGHFGLG
jgi:hypothetical protein